MSSKPVDTAIVMVVGPCINDTDFKSLEESIAYNAAGMDISRIVEKTDGTSTVTAITLTTGGTNDWTHKDGGYYEVEITAAQNTEEGISYLRGVCDGVLPFESVARYDIVKANIYDSLVKGTDVLQVDVTQLLGSAWLTPGVAGTPDVNAKLIGATAQTGRDIGASVLLSAGTGAGQLDFTSGIVKSNLTQILAHLLTQTGTQLADGFEHFFDVATPTGTLDSLPAAAPNAAGGLPISAAGGLAMDTLADWVDGGRLDNLLDAIPTTAMRGTDSATLATTWTDARAGYLDNLSVGAVALASGVDLTSIHGAALTETVNGYLAAAFTKLFDVATPLLVSSEVMRGTDGANTTVPDAAGVAPTAAEIKTAIEAAGSHLALILADTGTDGVLLAATATSAQLVDDVWDELLIGATHNIATSAGRILRETGDAAIIRSEETAQAGAAGSITLAAEASAIPDFYIHSAVIITDGTGVGQARTISAYNGSSKVATVCDNWSTNPDNTSKYVIRGHAHASVYDLDASALAQINTECDAALSDINLDHLVKVAVDTDWATTVHLDSVLGHIADVGASATFSRTTDALEAIRDRGDTAWITATGFNTTIPDVAGTAAGLHTTTDGKIDALNNISVANIIAGITDGTLDLQEMMRIILSATAGKSSGGGTVTLVFRDSADSKDRITATVDATGNRTAMTVDGS